MARGVNKAIIIGTLGQDPDVKYTPNGTAVTNISVATNEEWKDKNTGEKQERTEWHRVVFFGRLAEIVSEYLRKGSQVYIEGRIQTRKWQDKDGIDRYTTEIVALEMQMLGGKGGERKTDAYDNQAPAQTNQPSNAPSPQPSQSNDDFDDDIPF